MGIQSCQEATKGVIREFLHSKGKANISKLDYNQKIELSRDIVKPKCHKGHTINHCDSGTYKCDSGRSGDKCLK